MNFFMFVKRLLGLLLLFVDLQVHIAAEFYCVCFTYVGCLLFVLSAAPRLLTRSGLTGIAPEVAFI